MTELASKLVAGAKDWASKYGDFTQGEEATAYTVPLRIIGAWDNNDADGVADVFIENGSWLAGDEQLKGREAIRTYLRETFAGPYRGSRSVQTPLKVKLITDDVALAVTDGGVLYKDEDELPADRVMRATWIMVKQDGDWHAVSYQSSPVKG
jgi:uncharacterized protein (TIGR02246 family)